MMTIYPPRRSEAGTISGVMWRVCARFMHWMSRFVRSFTARERRPCYDWVEENFILRSKRFEQQIQRLNRAVSTFLQTTQRPSIFRFGARNAPRNESSVNLGLGNCSAHLQEIKIAAFVRLTDMLREHRAVAALVSWGWRCPRGASAHHLLFAHMQMD